ncbi:S9 family peptidase [Variovorax paradoxus]|uniref:alpha/beta hydrolase family protein n=1 Tax=Variovorax paradoxus TaxID=34073 RepID=UPI0019320A2A|nr:alpha/beta hydrolase [Variovorax paradoxus]
MSKQIEPARYEPDGWKQWPGEDELSFQFVRVLAAAQENASTISECFQAASRMVPGDVESWYTQWQRLGKTSEGRADAAHAAGHLATAQNNWLRAANYYRSSEFYLMGHDPRRLQAFDAVERCSHQVLKLMNPIGEIVKIPYENGAHLDAYFLRAPQSDEKTPVVICHGGLDEYKDELLHEITRHAFARGLSLLLVDMPGQGGTLRRQKIVNRHDTEVPIGHCIDWLLARGDVDPKRIALYGASLGGYYAPRAAAFEHRLAACVADCVIFEMDFAPRMSKPDALIWRHLKWVFGKDDMQGVVDKAKQFSLSQVIGNIKCPFLIVHGELDFAGTDHAHKAYEAAKKGGVDVDIKWFDAEETGASHCQIDNLTLGMEYVCDWLAKKLGVDEAVVRKATPKLA